MKVTMSIFLCIACIAGNCSLWWYFQHIKRENMKLTLENEQLENRVNHVKNELNGYNEKLNEQSSAKTEMKSSAAYYNNQGQIALSIVHEDRSKEIEEKDVDDNKLNLLPNYMQFDNDQVEGSDDSELEEKHTDDRKYRKTKIKRPRSNNNNNECEQ